ncbi:unnamed protein product [Alternaria alternata]
MALNAIPSNLESLRLENLPGITEKSIQRFAISQQANSIQKLALIDLDIESVIQSLCKPLATALLPSDTSKFATASRISTSDGFSIMLEESATLSPKMHGSFTYRATSTSRVDSVVGSTMFDPSPTEVVLTPMRSRLVAQSRILAARKNATMVIRVFDPEGEVRVNKIIGGHIGHIDSKITYDIKTAGRSGWITGIADLVGDKGTELLRCNRASCGHFVSGGTGHSVLMAEDLF